MADGRHLEKLENRPYLSNGLTDQHEIWHDDTDWTSEAHHLLKFQLLKIQDGGWPPS